LQCSSRTDRPFAPCSTRSELLQPLSRVLSAQRLHHSSESLRLNEEITKSIFICKCAMSPPGTSKQTSRCSLKKKNKLSKI
jgi:hypothetical protein